MAIGTIAALAAPALLRAGGNIYAGSQEFTRDDRERLRELERQQALGMLGMSPAERERAQRQIMQPLQTIEREAAMQRGSELAAQDLGQGAAYRQMLAEDQLRQQGRLAAQQMLQQQQEAAIARDEAEIARLEDARKRRRQMMVGGATEALAQGAEAAYAGYQMEQQQALQRQYYQDMMALAREQQQALQYVPPTNYAYANPTQVFSR
jgi:hypothetical protein